MLANDYRLLLEKRLRAWARSSCSAHQCMSARGGEATAVPRMVRKSAHSHAREPCAAGHGYAWKFHSSAHDAHIVQPSPPHTSFSPSPPHTAFSYSFHPNPPRSRTSPARRPTAGGRGSGSEPFPLHGRRESLADRLHERLGDQHRIQRLQRKRERGRGSVRERGREGERGSERE